MKKVLKVLMMLVTCVAAVAFASDNACSRHITLYVMGGGKMIISHHGINSLSRGRLPKGFKEAEGLVVGFSYPTGSLGHKNIIQTFNSHCTVEEYFYLNFDAGEVTVSFIEATNYRNGLIFKDGSNYDLNAANVQSKFIYMGRFSTGEYAYHSGPTEIRFGSYHESISPSKVNQSVRSLVSFASNRAGNENSLFKGLKIWNDQGELAHDIVAALNESTNEPCIIDAITGLHGDLTSAEKQCFSLGNFV